MFWTIASLILLVVLGGFISYYGDLQGRRWGRKRVSLFGMRPKHTAILLTTITGAFISLFSILTLLIVSAPLREVILHGEEAIRQNHRLRSEREKEVTLLKLTETQFAQTKNSLEKNRLLLSKSQRHLKNTTGQLADETIQLQRVANMLATTQKKLDQSRLRLVAIQNKQLELTRVNQTLAVGNSSLGKQSREESYQYRETRLELTKAKQRLKDLSQQAAIITDITPGTGNELVTSYLRLREERICIRSGAELYRFVVPGNLSKAAAESILQNGLRHSSVVAMSYGAAVVSGNLAVHIISGTKEPITTSDNTSLNAMANRLSGAGASTLVVVTSAVNTVEGEQCPVTLNTYPLRPVFKPGEVLATCTLKGGVSSRELLQEIATFLQDQVKKAAHKAGIVPRMDPKNGESEIGNFGPFSLVELANRIHNIKGTSELKAVAITTITSADLLDASNLKLEVTATGKSE